MGGFRTESDKAPTVRYVLRTGSGEVESPTRPPQAARVLSEVSKLFVVGDLGGESQLNNVVCSQCFGSLDIEQRRNVTVHGGECVLCRMREQDPAASTKPYCRFMTENPTVFHAVDYFSRKAAALGYQEVKARDDWTGVVVPGGKYFLTRNGSSIVAFNVGKDYVPGNGIAVIAGHIDALTAKLKPTSDKPVKAGYVELGVAPYAGGLDATWWDRDLGVGGRVVVRDETGKTTTRLVNLNWPSE